MATSERVAVLTVLVTRHEREGIEEYVNVYVYIIVYIVKQTSEIRTGYVRSPIWTIL